MTDSVITAVDAGMYVVLSKEEKHIFFMGNCIVPQNVWRYSPGVLTPRGRYNRVQLYIIPSVCSAWDNVAGMNACVSYLSTVVMI